jgi:hypothetical protein
MLPHKSRVFSTAGFTDNVVSQIPSFFDHGMCGQGCPTNPFFLDRGICGHCRTTNHSLFRPRDLRLMSSQIPRFSVTMEFADNVVLHIPRFSVRAGFADYIVPQTTQIQYARQYHRRFVLLTKFYPGSMKERITSRYRGIGRTGQSRDGEALPRNVADSDSPLSAVKVQYFVLLSTVKAYLTWSCPSEAQSVRPQTSSTFHNCWAHAFQRTNLGRMLSKNEHLTDVQAKRTIWVPQIVAETMPIRPFLIRDKNKNRNE